MTSATPKKRCAIYTRKSTEEGLEQGFNSLDAQREACEAYITSQKAEGWTALKEQYDDGGYSGGTLERPALQRLFGDIEAGRVDVVVVYKIDRLTRSLMDFAKLVEVFERRNVTFVSVTQSFNTTTSMGRLTLNVLLSFAQFEREVISERVRDKFAASKKKGMWMGGNPPLGYDIADRKLVVIPAEADTVRAIFQRYLDLGSVHMLRNDLKAKRVGSKAWVSQSGRQHGGMMFSHGALYCVLKSRTYIGEVYYKGVSYPGEHKAIVSREVFDAVQERLAASRQRHKETTVNTAQNCPLTGLIFDDRGNPMTPTYSRKAGKRQYRYYVSSPVVIGQHASAGAIPRVPGQMMEELVRQCLRRIDLVREQGRAGDGAAVGLNSPISGTASDTGARKFPDCLRRVEIHGRSVILNIDRADALASWRRALDAHDDVTDIGLVSRHRDRLTDGATLGDRDDALILTLAVRAKFRGGRTQILSEDGRAVCLIPRTDTTLLKGVARAHAWTKMLAGGEITSVEELAECAKQDRGYVARLLRLGFLSPDITRAILEGRQRPDLRLVDLLDGDIPLSWAEQAQRFG